MFFLPLTSQKRLESSDEKGIWHEYNLRNSAFNGSSLTLFDLHCDVTIDVDTAVSTKVVPQKR